MKNIILILFGLVLAGGCAMQPTDCMKEHDCKTCEDLRKKIDAIKVNMSVQQYSSYDRMKALVEEWESLYECYQESCE